MAKARSCWRISAADADAFATVEPRLSATQASPADPLQKIPAGTDDGFVPLFNGKDLAGWKKHTKEAGNWRVEDGAIVGSGPGKSYLYSERADIADFHLRMEASVDENVNSGVWFRTSYGMAWPVEQPVAPLGYEAQICNRAPPQAGTGSLFIVDGKPGSGQARALFREQLVKGNDWFTFEVIARDNHFVIKVNDRTTADFVDANRNFVRGHLTLQQFDPQTVVKFRKIEIKELVPQRQAVAGKSLPQVLLNTSKGDILLEPYEDEAPNTVANFVSLVEKSFYDGLNFHRVVPGFMAQGGDPQGNGSGGPGGYSIRCECDRADRRKHDRGAISMAHAGKNTGGSQFFVMLKAAAHLDGKHTVFGHVIKGLEVVDQLKQGDVIDKATVEQKRDHEYKPDIVK